MNNKIKLAVAGAVLSAASMANAGIIIPAGDWTLDINGNVNAFAVMGNQDKRGAGTTVSGAIANLKMLVAKTIHTLLTLVFYQHG